MTATAIREEVENVTRDGLRAQKSPPPGERPGCLVDPGPQRSDRTVRRSAGDSLPTPGLPVLAGASGEAVDAFTLSFLTAKALEDTRKEEVARKEALKEAKRRKKQDAVDAAMVEFRTLLLLPKERETPETQRRLDELHQLLYSPSSSSGARRKRKKRRKRRKPRTSSLPGCAHRRHRLWHVSLRHVVDVPVVRFVLVPQVLFFGFYADWISSNDEICADSFIYFWFKLDGKGRSEQWEVFLYCDKTIKGTVIARKCCPGLCLRLPSVVSASVRRPSLTRSSPSTSCVCHPSVAASSSCGGGFSLLVVLTIRFGTW